MFTQIKTEVTEDILGYPCHCGGFASRVPSSDDEIKANGCGRDRPGHECCCRSYQCRVCGSRHSGSIPAPDMDYQD